MEYFPPKDTFYKWGEVRQHLTYPFRRCHVDGIAYPQHAVLTCWEITETHPIRYIAHAGIYCLDGKNKSIKSRKYAAENSAIREIEKRVKIILEKDTPVWASEALKLGWRTPA